MEPSYYVCQATIPNIDAIIKFEQYKDAIQNQTYYVLEFSQQNYICLQDLIEFIKNEYISFNIQQVVTIIDHILNHFKSLFDRIKSTHGNLVDGNIFIYMQNIHKMFNLNQEIIQIERIHFVNYKQYFQLNRKKDFQDIKTIIITLFSYTRQGQLIENLIKQISNIDSINDLIKLIKELNKQYSTQKFQNFVQDQKIHNSKIFEKVKKVEQVLFKKRGNFDSSNSIQNGCEVQKIYQFLLSLQFTTIIKNFYCEIEKMRSNSNKNWLEHYFNDMLDNSKNKKKSLKAIMKQISQIIDTQYKGQLIDQNNYKENNNLTIGILNQKELATIFYLLLCDKLVQRPDFTQNLQQIVKQIENQLKEEIKLYQKYEIKIQISSLIQRLI